MDKKDIKALFDKFNASISVEDVWNVQAATVIKHKALERLAAAAKIEFDQPVIIRADREEAVILVTGWLDGRSEWSIGEALVNVNYRVSGKQAAYVYAMAEKRAKDRVIIKLTGLHGLYSEDEADESSNSAPAALPGGSQKQAVNGNGSPSAPVPPAPLPESARTALVTCRGAVTRDELRGVWKRLRPNMKNMLDADEFNRLEGELKTIADALPANEQTEKDAA